MAVFPAGNRSSDCPGLNGENILQPINASALRYPERQNNSKPFN